MHVKAVTLQHGFGENELGIEILLLRRIVYDADSPQRSRPSLQLPLISKHRRDDSLETLANGQEKVIVHFFAAGPLGIQKGGIEKSTSRIGIDLDELGTPRCQVKVISHEDAKRAEVMARYLGCGRQNLFAIGRKTADPFSCLYRGQHAQEVLLRDKGGSTGKQMWMCKLQFGPHFLVTGVDFQMLQKHIPVKRHTKTSGVKLIAQADW